MISIGLMKFILIVIAINSKSVLFSSFFSKFSCSKSKKREEKEIKLINAYKAEINQHRPIILKKNKKEPPLQKIQDEKAESNNLLPNVQQGKTFPTAPIKITNDETEMKREEPVLLKNKDEEPPKQEVKDHISENSNPIPKQEVKDHIAERWQSYSKCTTEKTFQTPPTVITDIETKINFDNYVEFSADGKKYHLQATGVSTVIKYFFNNIQPCKLSYKLTKKTVIRRKLKTLNFFKMRVWQNKLQSK